jgi:hypothetical protein
MTAKLVLDCESFEVALESLARIFQTTPDSLKALLSFKEIVTLDCPHTGRQIPTSD